MERLDAAAAALVDAIGRGGRSSSRSGSSGSGGSGSGSSGGSGGSSSGTVDFSAAPVLLDGAELKPRAGLSAAATDVAAEAVAANAAAESAPEHRRRSLLQSAGAPPASARVSPRRRGARGSSGAGTGAGAAARASGFALEALPSAYAGGASGAPALAASYDRLVRVAAGVLEVVALGGGGATAAAAAPRNATTLSRARLQDLFAPVGASNCRLGVLDPAAAFDAAARRFYVAAACGGTGSALLAVTAGADPHGAWYLYNLPADGAATRAACASGESAHADYTRLGFNADALAVTLHAHCPSAAPGSSTGGGGAALLVLPKGALARGETRVAFAVFTAHEVADALGGGGGGSGSPLVAQLEPAAPQRAEDVAPGAMYFVADVRAFVSGGSA